MILENITFLLDQIYKHMAYQSDRMERFEKDLSHVKGVVADPTGEVTFGGVAKVRPEEARQSLEGIAHSKIESVNLQFRFSQHLYLSIKPDLNKRIRKALEEAPLQHLTNAFKSYERLTELMLVVEQQVRDTAEKIHEVNGEIEINVQALINQKFEEQQRKLDATFAQAAEDRKKIDAAMKRLENQIERSKAVQAEAHNIVIANKPATSGFQMVKGRAD